MKKQKRKERDIFSKLPNDVISQIIARLPTNEAIRTAILSLRWKNLWKGINRISLSSHEQDDPNRFAYLVDSILKNCTSKEFLSFKLKCPNETRVSDAWISRALGTKIEKFSINVRTFFTSLPNLSTLPKCNLSNETLVTLKLKLLFDIQLPESNFCFPFLKTLALELMFPLQCSILHRLLSSCPVLEKFALAGHLDSGKGVKIAICGVPNLRNLSVCLRCLGHDDKMETCNVTIDAPNLEQLRITDDSLSCYKVKNVSSICHVNILYEATSLESLRPQHAKNLVDLLQGISSTHMLTLKFQTMDILRSARCFPWPIFIRMTMLKLHLHALSGWICFPFLLQSAPFLKVLILNLDGMNKFYSSDEDADEEERRPKVSWITPRTSPFCLSNHLRVIGIKCVQGHEDELHAIAFMLNNSQVLERMSIDFHPKPVIQGLQDMILTFPRASKVCNVEFY